MCSWSLELLFLFPMLTLGKPGPSEVEAANCTAAVNVERNTKYHIKSGHSAVILCPVKYCQKKPEIKWYKWKNRSDLILDNQQRHTFAWLNNSTFVLNISFVHKNDSGLYHCESISGDQKDKSHYINITVQDDNTNTTDSHGASKKDNPWIIYLLSLLGALCLIAVSCLGPLYFIWRHPVKNKKISSVSQTEMNVLNGYTDVKYCNNTIDVPDEGSVLHHSAATHGMEYKHSSTICDNQVSCWKAFRATSNLARHQSVTSIHHFPGEDQDMIVYASLNHAEHSQRSEPSVEIELTEYATVGQKT